MTENPISPQPNPDPIQTGEDALAAGMNIDFGREIPPALGEVPADPALDRYLGLPETPSALAQTVTAEGASSQQSDFFSDLIRSSLESNISLDQIFDEKLKPGQWGTELTQIIQVLQTIKEGEEGMATMTDEQKALAKEYLERFGPIK